MSTRTIHLTRSALAAGALALVAAGLPVDTAKAQVVPTEWFKTCAPQAENEICNTQFTLIAQTGQLVTAVNLITVSGQVNQRILQAVVPIGRVIPDGVQLQVDQNAAQTLPYSVCFPNRCIAEIELTDALVNSMKAGSALRVTSVNFERQPNPVNVTLAGFTAAYDGPPQDAGALQARQEELNQAMQAQAEARRQRFEEAQNEALQTGAAPAQ